MKKFLAVTIVALAALSLVSSAAQASTMGHREALDAAKPYLRSGHLSRAGLIDQRDSPYGEDFSHSDTVWGVNHAHANWYADCQVVPPLGPLLAPWPHRPARIPVRRALHAR